MGRWSYDPFAFVISFDAAGVLPLTALEDEEEDVEVMMAGWTKVGHFWPVTALAQFRTGPYVSNGWDGQSHMVATAADSSSAAVMRKHRNT